MATTYTLTSNSHDGRYLQLTCTQVKNSNNTSTINWTLTSTGGSGNYYSTGPTTVSIGGTQVYYKARVAYTSQAFPAAKGSTSGSLTVSHNSDGSKSLAVSLSTAIYTATVSTKSGTWTLDSMASPSTATMNNMYAGEETMCVITASNSSFTHKVDFTLFNQTTTVGTNLSSGKVRFLIPDSYNLLFSGASSATATITCYTYNGSTLIGTTTSTCTIYAKDVSGPHVEVYIYDVNDTTVALTGSDRKMIVGYSNIYYAITATSGSSTVSSYKAKNGTTVKSGRTGTFYGAASPTFTFTATDARGQSGQYSATLDAITYTPLTCNLTTSNMSVNGAMTISVKGNYFNQSFGAANNTLTVYYRYKAEGGNYGNWVSITATKSGNTYDATYTVSGLNTETTYSFQARAVDKLSDITSSDAAVQNKPIFDWSNEDFNFNVPVSFSGGTTGIDADGDLSVSGNATIEGDLRLKASDKNYGNTLYFGDKEYAYIRENPDDSLVIHHSKIHIGDKVYLANGLLMGDTFTPKLNAPVSYTTQSAWYQIVGRSAVIGFLISGSVGSGYHTTQIEISGFPYDIGIRGSGGGTAYNCYMTAGHAFNSWWMEENGVIKGRCMPVNNTTAGNLSIAQNVCYPTGGGTFTISGTITCRITNTEEWVE